MSVGRFLSMVGALVQRSVDGRYLILQRSPDKDFAAGAWECLTGRVDQGEDYTTALRREVKEELGVPIQIDFIVGTMHFYRGPTVPEYEMLGIVYCCSLEDEASIQISWEHSAMRWVNLAEAEDVFPQDYWLLDVIRRADRIRATMPEDMLDVHHADGFEIQ